MHLRISGQGLGVQNLKTLSDFDYLHKASIIAHHIRVIVANGWKTYETVDHSLSFPFRPSDNNSAESAVWTKRKLKGEGLRLAATALVGQLPSEAPFCSTSILREVLYRCSPHQKRL